MEIIQKFFTAKHFQLSCGKNGKEIKGENNIGDIQTENDYKIAVNSSQSNGKWNSLKSVNRKNKNFVYTISAEF